MAAISICGLFTLTWLWAMVLVHGALHGIGLFWERGKELCRSFALQHTLRGKHKLTDTRMTNKAARESYTSRDEH